MKFFDAEGWAVDYLSAELPTPVPVGVKPPVGPAEFVVITRTGGVRKGRVSDQPTMTFECYSESPAAALALCEEVRELLDEAPRRCTTTPRIYEVVEVSGPQSLPDPRHTSHRYTMTAAVHVRGRKAPAA